MSACLYSNMTSQIVRSLNILSTLLEKGAEHLQQQALPESTLLEARLAEDMFPLCRQVQIVSDMSKGAVARLAGVDIPSMEDNETSFAELQQRIAKTLAFINSVSAESFVDADGRAINIKGRSRELNFTAPDYVLTFVIPNLYFHLTTAYNIMRNQAVVIGKADFLGPL